MIMNPKCNGQRSKREKDGAGVGGREREREDGKAGWMGRIRDGARMGRGGKGSPLAMGEAVSNGAPRLGLL